MDPANPGQRLPRLGADGTCPRSEGNAGMGMALIDWLEDPHSRGKQTHFLSWCWGYKLSMVQDALRQWVKQTNGDPAKIFLWMCFFLNNQYDNTAFDSETLSHTFGENLKRIGAMVALLDGWDEPTYLKRIWCIFEQYKAIVIGIKPEMIMATSMNGALLEEVEKGKNGLASITKSLTHVQMQAAKATIPEDAEAVKKEIRESLGEGTVGYAVVNKSVAESLVRWSAETFKAHMLKLASQSVSSVIQPREEREEAQSSSSPLLEP